jgi:hypothetical protein
MRQEIIIHTGSCSSFSARAFLTIENKCNREGTGHNLLDDFKSKLISKVMMKGGVNKYILTPSFT